MSTNIYMKNEEKDIQQHIIKNMSECIWLYDLSHNKFRFVGPAVEQIIGFSVEEMIGCNVESILTSDSIKKIIGIIDDSINKIIFHELDSIDAGTHIFYFHFKNGSIQPLTTSLKFVVNKDNNTMEIIGVIRRMWHISEVESNLPLLNNFMKQTVQDTEHKTKVISFGKFTVYSPLSGEAIKWRTSKAEELFAFFVHNLDKDISKWTICDAIFYESCLDKMDVNLHTTIYKMKKTLKDANIKYTLKCTNGFYRMNLEDCFIDTVEFMNILNYEIEREVNLQNYNEIIKLYKGEYLHGNDYIWSLPIKEFYTKKAKHVMKYLINYYMIRNEYDTVELILTRILENFPTSEFAHESLLKLYFLQKNKTEFARHYKHMKNIFKTGLWAQSTELLRFMVNQMKVK